MTKVLTTHDDATDANTLDAEVLIAEAQRISMEPRSLTPYQQEEMTEAVAVLETFGTFDRSTGALVPFLVHTVQELVADYMRRIPAGQRRPSPARARRDVTKSIVSDAFDPAYRLGRVSLSTDPNDYTEEGWYRCPQDGSTPMPELVWYEKDEASAAAARGEAAWCYLYFPDTYESPSTDPFDEPGTTVIRSGMFNRDGLAGIAKTYPTLDDAEADMVAVRRAVATLRKLSDAIAPDDDDADDRPQPTGRPRIPMT